MKTGPDIVRDGLVFGYDIGYPISDNDTATRFSPGKPAVNSVPDADTMASWSSYSAGNDGTFVTEFGTTGYKIINRASWNGLYKDITLPSTGVYTFSAWFRLQHSSTGNNGATVYISGYGSGDTATAIDRSKIGEWQRIEKTVTVTDVTLRYYLISYGGSGATSSWEVTMPQVELASERTPFVNGTRSSTQGLLDLAGTTNIDVSNVSFDSTGQPEFDGTDDDIQLPTSLVSNLSTSELTVEAIVYHTSWGAAGSSRPYVANWNSWISSPANQRGFILRTYTTSQYPSFWYCWGSSYTSLTANTQMNLNQYYHVVGVFKKDSYAKIYVNGVEAGSTTTGTGNNLVYDDSTGTRIGYGTINTGRMVGNLPVVKIYNQALSSDEVQQNYNAYRKRFGI